MRALRVLVSLVSFLTLVAACRSEGALGGHIVISTKPVGSAQVRVIAEKDIAAYLDTKRPAAAAELAALRRDLDDASRAMNGAAGQIADLNRPLPPSGGASGGVAVQAPGAGGVSQYVYDTSKMDAGEAAALARQALAEAQRRDEIAAQAAARKQAALTPGLKTQVGAERERWRAAVDKLVAWEADVWSDLPPLVASVGINATSDAKGGFAVELPSRGRYAVLVEGSNVVNGVTRRRSWGVWVDLENQPSKDVQLGESNSLSTSAVESLLK